ncbi:MAG: alcohol dehydrogenase catalytic domain-containing protein [Planctomycetes bacterium]|nr:alcohol dehydrogenase catalytic domain-containing protein [Planctomycetota bacterium]
MKVAYLTGLRKLELREEPEPKIERADEVLLRIDRVGVCGSDVHYYANGRIGQQAVRYPASVGHEFSATVVETGSAAGRLKAGDRVAVDPALACGTCDQCRANRRHTCRNLKFMGSPEQAPGAVAEYRLAPAENCLAIPDSVSLDEAAMIEPLTVGLHAVRLGEVYPAAKVGVLGAGPIGLSVLMLMKVVAPARVYMTDLIDERLSLARQCGADWTGNAGREDVDAAIAEREPLGLDLVFECSGEPACVNQGIRLLAPGGRLVLVGIPPTGDVGFDLHAARPKELDFRNVRRQNGCMAPVVRLMAEGRIDVAPLVTHRFGLSEIRDAFELVAAYGDGVVKAMIGLSSAQ